MPGRAYLQAIGYLGWYGVLLWLAARHGGAVGATVALAFGLLLAWMLLPGFGLAHWRGPRGSRRIALTFDDGPNPPHTDAILEVLAQHGAKATFFMIGDNVALHRELVARLLAAGHEIGNHSHTHRKLAFCGPATIEREVGPAQRALEAAGARPRWFRAPHGFKSPFLGSILRRHGLRLVAWTRGCWDTDKPGVDTIVRRTVPRLQGGQILLLHDGQLGCDRSQTTAALGAILEGCRARGLTPVTLTELLEPS
jgi:peptidoglycan/xylan/chitin deacetylase (PgdA/CDA1 family)